jgi:K+-transporting ATPase A subunit
MFFGRFAHAILILAIAGSLAAKKNGQTVCWNRSDQ